MSARSLLVILALAAAPVLAGCVSPGGVLSPASVAPPALDLVAQAEALWDEHQNQPHPAYGWPTLTHPATGANVPALWKPIPNATLPATIKGLALLAKAPEGVKSGAGISLFGSIAVVPGFGQVSSIVDISDPTKPALLGQTAEKGHRGSAVLALPNGTLFAIMSTGKGFDVIDITDPTHPELVANATPKTGGHKLGLVPGTPFVYNANSRGDGSFPASNPAASPAGQTEIYDLSDPWNPVLVQEFKNGYGCHHIFFWISDAKQRALCAGIQVTQIWDIADPKAPKVLVSVPVHHGVTALPSTAVLPVMFSHTALLNTKGTVLIVGDEMGGGSIPPGCTAPMAPTGALWFYDVKDEKNPKLLGWFSPGVPLPKNPAAGSCTAHHGRIVPDAKRDLVAMAFYGAGTVLVDFTDPAMPKMVDQFDDGTNTWEAWYYNGYIFTGDLARGIDVLTLK